MDNHPMYSYADAGILKRAIRRSAGWKPLSLFYARTLHVIDKLVFRLTLYLPGTQVVNGIHAMGQRERAMGYVDRKSVV